MALTESSLGSCLFCFEFLQRSNSLNKFQKLNKILGLNDILQNNLRMLREAKIPSCLALGCCDSCHKIVQNICSVYSKIKRLKVQLNIKLNKLAGIIEVSNTVHSGKQERSAKLLGHLFAKNRKKNRVCQPIIHKSRSNILKTCCRKLKRTSTPRLPKRNGKIGLECLFESEAFKNKLVIVDVVSNAYQSNSNVANTDNTMDPLVQPKIEPDEIADDNLSNISLDNPFCALQNLDNNMENTTTLCSQAQVNLEMENNNFSVNTEENLVIENINQNNVQPQELNTQQTLPSLLSTQRKDRSGFSSLKVKTCTICEGIFISKKALNWHLCHIHFSKRKRSCDICLEPFTSKTALRNHIGIHESPEDWKWECEICKIKLMTKSKMNRHMKTHFPTSRNPEENLFFRKSSNVTIQSSKANTGLVSSPTPASKNWNGQ